MLVLFLAGQLTEEIQVFNLMPFHSFREDGWKFDPDAMSQASVF